MNEISDKTGFRFWCKYVIIFQCGTESADADGEMEVRVKTLPEKRGTRCGWVVDKCTMQKATVLFLGVDFGVM